MDTKSTYLQRAKALMRAGATKSALVIVPLAAAASAQAAAVQLAASPVYCSYLWFEGTFQDCGGAAPSASQLPAGGQGIEGLTLTTGAGYNLYSGGSPIEFVWGTGTLGASVSGSGIAATSMDVSYDFSTAISSYQGNPGISDWTLTMSVLQDDNTWASSTFTGSGGGEQTGSGSIAFTSTVSSAALIQATLSYNYESSCSYCSIQTAVQSGSTFSFADVPESSPATPEPATGGLVAGALGALGMWFRKRRGTC